MQKMQNMQKLQFILAVSVLCGVVLITPQAYGQKKAAPTTKPAGLDDVPGKVIKEMQDQFALPKGIDPVTRKRMLGPRMQKVLLLGKKAETKYPKATNLYQVHTIMLHAAGYLARQKDPQMTEKQYQELAKKILTSPNAPIEAKLNTEFILLSREVFMQEMPPQQIEKKLDALVKKYEKTPGAPNVLINAVVLLYQTQNQDLAGKYLEVLKKKYPDSQDTKQLIAAIDRMPKARGNIIGEVFEATLPTLDGKTITMPKDTMGKVVVVDFWASWCPPCRDMMPHLKKLYAKYAKNPDFMIIGISLDTDKPKLKQYLKDNEILWTNTCTGKKWQDPTVVKYGIDGTPSVWIIGKDGKVAAINAEGNEDRIVAKLLAEKPTTPPDKAGEPGKSTPVKTPNKPPAAKDK